MAQMIDIRKALEAHLVSIVKEESYYGFMSPSQVYVVGSITPGIYFRKAPDDARYPYLVYNLPNNVDDGEGHLLSVLDIDGWDMPGNGDSTPLENLMADVDDGVDKSTLITDKFGAVIYIERKLTLDDDDERIERRKYIYQLKLFGRGQNE